MTILGLTDWMEITDDFELSRLFRKPKDKSRYRCEYHGYCITADIDQTNYAVLEAGEPKYFFGIDYLGEKNVSVVIILLDKRLSKEFGL